MHEVGLMRDTMELALQQAAEHGAEQILTVRMRIGEISGVAPDALRFAFEAISMGTLAENARFEIESVPARVLCQICGHEGPANAFDLVCSTCGAFEIRVIAGREIELAELEIE